MTLTETVTGKYHKLFNAKFAIISAACNGPIAAWVNHDHGTLEAMAAGATQTASSFISTGLTARLVQHFSPIESRFVSYFFGSLVPTTATFLLSYAGHWLNDMSEIYHRST